MIGSDWLERHKCIWDFGGGQLFIDGRPAVTVTRRKKLRCRRLFSGEDIVIPPRQQIQASARSTLSSLTTPVGTEMVEAREVKPLSLIHI